MSSSENHIGNRVEPHASNPASDVLRLSTDAFVSKAALEAGKYWDEMHGRDATSAIENETHPANEDRLIIACAAATITIVEISGRTHIKLVDTLPHSENPKHFVARFPGEEVKGYASKLEHVAEMLRLSQQNGHDKKTFVTMRPAYEDEFDEVNTPEALKTIDDNTGRTTHRYRD
ncbi:hypothetical protein FCIRC_11539 [Fusarium circinatum]|uniref:Uncharacterized protein n=1 Tax=Fusarium circinatum TaxID=48490 RepID=A0A8H5WKV5_FUSCI|nr:hypothetical protein FCIRC_11539 [Fusarium circinatum]